MKKVRRKPPEERAVRYLDYKSYHVNRSEAPSAPIRQVSRSTMVSQTQRSTVSNAKLSVPPIRPSSTKQIESFVSTSRKGKSTAIKPIDSQLTPKNTVCLGVYNKLKTEFEKSKEDYAFLEKENEELRTINNNLISSREDFQERIIKLEHENEELTDRLELNKDQIKHLNDTNEKQSLQLKELQERIIVLMNEKEATLSKFHEAEGMNKDLRDLICELKQASEEKDQAIDVLSGYKNKWEAYRTRLQAALSEKEELINKTSANEKFVSVLESDIHILQERNRDLREKNDQLIKHLTEKKRNEEILRHKYDEMKKLNKSYREKETRYMIHDGMPINVGKYTLNNQIPSLIGEDGRTLNRIPSRNYSATYNAYASIGKKSKTSNQTLYNLLGQSGNGELLSKIKRN